MRLILHMAFACLATVRLLAQSDTLQEAVPLQETVISANRSAESANMVVQQVLSLRAAQIQSINAQTTADLLQNTGQVMVQKSQQGGGSPVLRGFEASRILLVVDGVRLNNAIYRAGHLQNAITVDNAALERLEVLFGPASTVYGTDALGGAVCLYTKQPQLAAPGEPWRFSGEAFARYGSANREKTAHFSFSLGGQKLALFTSATASEFGDLRMGARTGGSTPFGERPYYIERINGRDSLVANDNPLIQRFSGYKQYDFLQKLRLISGEYTTHTLNLQYSTSSNIPRYDRLTDIGGQPNTLRSAEWYYGPQDRRLASYTLLHARPNKWYDRMQIIAAYQDIRESRHNRNVGSYNLRNRLEAVDVWSLNVDAQKKWRRSVWRYGIDLQHNWVTSEAYTLHIEDFSRTPLDTRYPGGGSSMTNAAVYATTTEEVRKWVFTSGLRLGYSWLNAQFSDKTFFDFPFKEATQRIPVASANSGLALNLNSQWRFSANISSGFRAPNVDDLSRVFETGGNILIVPNPDIGAEKTINFEVNTRYTLPGRLRWDHVFWVTGFFDAIVLGPSQYNGQDSVKYDGVMVRVMANKNERFARLWGYSSQLSAEVADHWALNGALSYTNGTILDEAGNKPLDHIPPLTGKIGLKYFNPRSSVEFFGLFNGPKPIHRYALNGEDNMQYARPEGTPAWLTLNLRASRQLGEYVQIQAGIENLLDMQYRVFASGINAPGRNIFVTARVRM